MIFWSEVHMATNDFDQAIKSSYGNRRTSFATKHIIPKLDSIYAYFPAAFEIIQSI